MAVTANEEQNDTEPVPLKFWAFNMTADNFGVVVDGYREQDDAGQTLGNWSTTTIKKVTGHGKVVETTSGRIYKLQGDADKMQLKKNGFPETMIQLFAHGFPQNWESMLKEYWEKRKSTNPLNANNWFDHKMGMDLKRKSMGVKINNTKTRQSCISSTSEAVDKNPKQPSVPPTPTQIGKKEPIRRSPRIANMDIIPATPNTASNITSNSMQAKKKPDDEPTPRFVPQSDGRSLRRRSAPSANSTPVKPKNRQTAPDFIFPNVSAISTTPRRRSASQSPAVLKKQTEKLPQTPTTRANSVRESRSTSVKKEAPKATTPRATPRKSTVRASTVNPNSVGGRQVMQSPAEATPQKAKKSSQTPMETEFVEDVPTVKNTDMVVATISNNEEGNQTQNIPTFDDFKAPKEFARPPRPIRAQSAPSRRQAMVLSDWHIKFMPEMEAKSGNLPPFTLIGYQTNGQQPVEEGQFWHTSLIERVLEGGPLHEWTFYTSRSEYKLMGKVNIREMCHLGFTQDFVRAFLHGFPLNWREMLWTAYHERGELIPKPVPRLEVASQNTIDAASSSTRFQREGSAYQEPLSFDAPNDYNSTTSSRGRSLRKTENSSVLFPQLNVQKGGSQRVKPKKRTINYSSSSSSDNEAIIRTLRDVNYGDELFNKRGPSKKRKRRAMEESDDESSAAAELIKKISKKKLKLKRQIDVLDEKMEQIVHKMAEKVARQERINTVKARDRELRESKIGSRRNKKTENTRHVNYTSSSESDLTSSDEESTETEVTDDGGEWKKTPKYRRHQQRAKPAKKRPIKKKDDSASELNLFEDINNEISDDEEEVEKPKKIKKRTWKQIDLDRLKQAISALKVNSDEDWENVAKTLGTDFLPEDCKDMAVKKLHWKPRQPKQKQPEGEALVVTAREGTQAYGIQMNEQHRKFMLGAGSQGGDCFREQAPDEDDEMAMTNLADLDDSILAALRTPSVGEMPKTKRGGPCLPKAFEEDEDDGTPRVGRKSLAAEQNTAQRESHQRYLHQITNNRSFFNTSKVNNTRDASRMETSRQAENIGKKIARIKKDAQNHGRKKRSDDIEEEDDDLVLDA